MSINQHIDKFTNEYCYPLLAVVLGGLLMIMSLGKLLDLDNTRGESIKFIVLLCIGTPAVIGGIIQGLRKWRRSRGEECGQEKEQVEEKKSNE